jgi:hypothetical protein
VPEEGLHIDSNMSHIRHERCQKNSPSPPPATLLFRQFFVPIHFSVIWLLFAAQTTAQTTALFTFYCLLHRQLHSSRFTEYSDQSTISFPSNVYLVALVSFTWNFKNLQVYNGRDGCQQICVITLSFLLEFRFTH